MRRLAGAGLAVALLSVSGVGFVIWRKYEVLSAGMPTVGGLRNYQPPVMSRIYAGDGRVIAELAAERRIFAPYAAIPERVKAAFTSAEDQNFWTHGGVDPLAILRAAVTDLETMHSGRRPIGASTITQQVAKIMLLNSNVLTFERKVKEALLAMRIEQTLSKQRILEIYLNEIYLGAGAYGIAAASQTYFNKPLDQLDDAEAAFLGALPKSPTNYNPYRFPAAARARRLGARPHGRDPRDHRAGGTRGDGRAADPALVPASRAGARIGVVLRGGAARAARSLRPGPDHAGWLGGADQPRSDAAAGGDARPARGADAL